MAEWVSLQQSRSVNSHNKLFYSINLLSTNILNKNKEWDHCWFELLFPIPEYKSQLFKSNFWRVKRAADSTRPSLLVRSCMIGALTSKLSRILRPRGWKRTNSPISQHAIIKIAESFSFDKISTIVRRI